MVTPGPWYWSGTGYLVSDATEETVAGGGNGWHVEVPNSADKSLIAAAPEMLAFLEWFVNDTTQVYETDLVPMAEERARNLIAKVRGES